MSSPVPKLACRKRFRSCDSSKKNIQSDGEEEKEKKQKGDGKVKNMTTFPVFPKKVKEKKILHNSSSRKKTRTDDYKEGETKIDNEVKNGKASATFFEKKSITEKLKSSSNKNTRTEDDVREEEVDTWNNHSKVKSRKVSTVSHERGERRKRQNNSNYGKKNHGNGDEREERYVCCWDSKVKHEEDVSATSLEKEKERKRLSSTNNEKKVQRDDKKYEKNVQSGQYDKVKSRKVSAASFEKKKKKMPSCDNVEKKINGADRNRSLSFSKNKMQSSNGKKRTEPITSTVEKKMKPYKSTEIKLQHDGKQKNRVVPSDMSKEKKKKASIDSNYKKRKREESNALFKNLKSMQSDDNNKKIHSGKVKKKNRGDGKEKERNIPFSFFKVICNNFKESLSIPPTVAPELEDLTNHHVYLEDSEGNFSKIRLSVVNGTLAFHQGWNIFVSDHLIKWGEFLLFEYTANSKFSVRIFGRDSCERLHFNVRRKREGVRKNGVRKREGVRSHDDLISFDVKSEDNEADYYFSGEYPRNKEPETLHVTVHTAEDPKRVERMVGSGPVPLDNGNGKEVIQQCGTQGMSPLRRKEKRVILITDSGSSIHERHENDIVKLITSTADSDTHRVVADTNKDPKRVQNGIGNEQSAVLGVEKERLTDVDCGTKCTSPKSSVEKAANSAQSGIENGLSTAVEHEKGSLPDIECGTKCTSPECNEKEAAFVHEAPLAHENHDTSKDDLNLHDSEDLRRKQEISSIDLECTTAVNKYSNDGEMNAVPDICRNYEAPGGFRCLEKWRSRIMRHRAVLDGTGLIKPQSIRETDSKFVVEYGAVGLNPGDKCVLSKDTHAYKQQIFTMPIQDPAHPDRVSMCEHDGTESYHSIDGKGLSPARSEGTYAFVELQPTGIKNPSSPDRISKCGDSLTEVSDDIDGKGTAAKLETKMGHLEPMGSIVGTQTTNIPVCANNAAAWQSEHCIFKQEDTNSVDFPTPAKPEILESDDHSVLKVNLQFYIPNTTRKWLELPKSLSNAVRQRKQDRNIIMLKDPMKRLWPVFYHENSIFVGFTAGWRHFAAANDLQIGDVCELFKEAGDEEPVYSVQITKK